MAKPCCTAEHRIIIMLCRAVVEYGSQALHHIGIVLVLPLVHMGPFCYVHESHGDVPSVKYGHILGQTLYLAPALRWHVSTAICYTAARASCAASS